MNRSSAVDRNGHPVAKGDRVRLFATPVLKGLDEIELAKVASVAGQPVEVLDVNEDGRVRVILDWLSPDAGVESFVIVVDADAIEFFSRGAAGAV